MATIWFLTPEREEKSWALGASRPLRIGRDPDNDVVLRDPRVSRHHARLVFEKGFFVLYDLASANGTYVNGKRVHVAPLVNGAVIRMGSTSGRFGEEPGSEPQTTIIGESVTAESEPVLQAEPSSTNPYPLGDRPPEEAESSSVVPGGSQYLIDLRDGTEPSAVRNGDQKPILYFYRPPRLIGWVGGLVAAMVGASGLTASVVLAMQGRPVPLAAVAGLTILFVFLILRLIPRKEIQFCSDEAMHEVDLVLRQENKLPIPTSEYHAIDRSGHLLARFRKNHMTNLGRRRWWILNQESLPIGWAEEDSLPRAMARKVAGNAVRALRSNYRLIVEGQFVGRIDRRERTGVLDLGRDEQQRVDRRVAIPLSVLILAIDAK